MSTTRHNATIEIDSLRDRMFVTVDIEYTYSDGEPRTYDYPGSPPEIELQSVVVSSASGVDWDMTRAELALLGGDGSWLKMLDQIVDCECEDGLSGWLYEDLSYEAEGDFDGYDEE